LEFLAGKPDEASWRKFCAEFHLKRKDGTPGPRVEYVRVNVGEPTEYKDMSKDGTGAYRKALKGHKGQIVFTLTNVDKKDDKKETVEVRPVYAFEAYAKVAAALKQQFGESMQIRGFFQSGCMIEVTSEVFHAQKPLPPGNYLLNTILTDSKAVKITSADGTTYPTIPRYSLANMLKAGMRRAT
jgi:hypothetical protein